MAHVLLEVILLGWVLNVATAAPYYTLVLSPRAADDDARREELVGTVGLSLIPWLHFLLIALIVVVALISKATRR